MLNTTPKGALYVCGRCITEADRQFMLGNTAMAGVCSRCMGQAVWLLDARVNDPHLAHSGVSPTFSTGAALLPWPLQVWDVNGYYRDLGVRPGASKDEIVQAYIALGPEPPSRQTYCIKQLLDPEIRARYDSCQLGELFFDQHLQDVVMRRAKAEAAEAIAKGEADEDDLESMDLSDVLNSVIAMLDSPAKTGKDDRSTASDLWGYFLWRSVRSDTEPLARWRALLSEVWWERGRTESLAVGFVGGEIPWQVEQVGKVRVVFISDSAEPTRALADQVAQAIIQRG